MHNSFILQQYDYEDRSVTYILLKNKGIVD